MSRTTKALLALVLLALAAPASAAAAPEFKPVNDVFAGPVYVAAPPRDTTRLFVVEVGGTIKIVRDNGVTNPTPFLEIPDVLSGGERGLLSMAFAPDYATSGLFYVYLTAAPNGELQVREYRRSATDADHADPGSERIVWRQAHDQAPNHNGGQIEWGPDGFLWFATGDGGGSNDVFGHARDLSSQLGKVLRIDPRPGNAGSYSVPADNPFGSAVWAYGLRNPFRFSFDRGSGDLFIGDVGQGTREEVDWARAAEGLGRGADYGWACREGTQPGPKSCATAGNYLAPIFDYERDPRRAITGGYLVRDPGLPTLNGRYVYVDYFGGDIRSFRPARPRAADDRPTGLTQTSVASFGEDACGHLYVASLEDGTVQRVQDGPTIGRCVLRPVPPPLPPRPAAPPPATTPASPRIPDRTSPRVSIRVARKGRVGRRATPRILLVATETCRVTIRARLAGTRFKRVRAMLRAGRRTVVRLRPRGRRAVKRIHRSLRRHRRVTLTVSVTAVDAAGNTGRVQRRLKVRRA